MTSLGGEANDFEVFRSVNYTHNDPDDSGLNTSMDFKQDFKNLLNNTDFSNKENIKQSKQ